MTNDEALKGIPRSGLLESKITPEMIAGKDKLPVSNYKPTPEELDVRMMIIKHFTLGDLNQRKPRREFNDLALLVRAQIDRMAFNAYQPNDGDPTGGNITQAWKCLSEDSQILTISGWKGIGEIKKGDIVFSYDLQTKEINPDTVRDYYEYQYEGELVNIKTKYTDQLITPNHRIIAKKYDRKRIGGGKKLNKYEHEWQYIEAHDLGHHQYKMPMAGTYDGAITIGEDIAELLGWIISEGDYDTHSQAINITQTSANGKKVERIRALINHIGVSFTEHSYNRIYKGKPFQEFRFRLSAKDPITKRIRRMLPDKKPTYDLLNLTIDEKKRLLDGLMLGDGYSLNRKYLNFSQKDKQTLIWFQTFIHLMGKISIVGEKNACIHYDDETETRKNNRKLVSYTGKVWSITTGRTNYIAKRNGLIFITGNSNAMRPIQRNKVISIAAHATARILFPKIFAQDEESEDQEEAAQVMEDLMEWSGQQSSYTTTGLYATINALVEPASIIYTDYSETYRRVKSEKGADGKWVWTEVIDDTLSGFQDAVVPVDELYIENFYEHDIQKQGWLIWRRVHNYSLMEAKYGHLKNFQYVHPGVQIIYDDANRLFYEVYDSSMRGEMCEEIIYWNRTNDLKIIIVNGVMVTDFDNPNPRQDKLYPFTKFGYELIDGGRCFYYKSLVFKMNQDAKVINTLYQMVMDGTYLQLFPPMINKGGETIGSDVLIPGAVTTFTSPDADLRPLTTNNNIGSGIQAMGQVESSISETSMDQWMQGTAAGAKRQSAYSMSIIQQNANTLLGLFIQMISIFVKDFGTLRMGDILQYMTIVDVNKIEDDGELVFKAFLLHNKQSEGKQITKKIQFDSKLPEGNLNEDEETLLSLKTLEMGGGTKSKQELWRVNPQKFRDLEFSVTINPDVLNPMSEETEKQYGLEAYDRLIQNPSADPEMVTKEFLLKNYKQSQRDPDKFIKSQSGANPNDPLALAQQVAQNGGQPLPGGKPPVQNPNQPSQAQVAGGLPKQ